MTDVIQDDEQRHQTFDDRDRAILELERGWWKYLGAKEAEVMERFGISITKYYQRLHWILAQPEALAYDAATVRRLHRLRDSRAAARLR